jgi:hypothetical protein
MSVWKCLKLDKLNVKHVKKKIYVVKKNLGIIFLNFFSLNPILIYILNYFYHFRPFSYYKKCAYLKEVIRRDSDQCGVRLHTAWMVEADISISGYYLWVEM